MPKPTIQYCLELLSHLPPRVHYRLADLIGFVVRNTSNQISTQTRQNIDLCFTELEKSERQRLYRESIRHTCYTMAELAAVWCGPVDKILARITSHDICDEFKRSTGGRIILAPHLGSWETLAVWLGDSCNAMMMYKRRNNKKLDGFIKVARARSGGSLVSTQKRGLRKLLIGIKKGANLMILPDQKPGRNKVHIESKFFGASAPTTSLVQSLCSKIDCDVFLATVYRSSPPGEFGLSIHLLDRERLIANEIDSTQYMNDQIELLVRQHLEQYQWGYRRFATRAYTSVK